MSYAGSRITLTSNRLEAAGLLILETNSTPSNESRMWCLTCRLAPAVFWVASGHLCIALWLAHLGSLTIGRLQGRVVECNTVSLIMDLSQQLELLHEGASAKDCHGKHRSMNNRRSCYEQV